MAKNEVRSLHDESASSDHVSAALPHGAHVHDQSFSSDIVTSGFGTGGHVHDESLSSDSASVA